MQPQHLGSALMVQSRSKWCCCSASGASYSDAVLAELIILGGGSSQIAGSDGLQCATILVVYRPFHLRIAKPMLLVTTPIGVVWGVVEAYRFKPILALLMCVLLSVISAFIGYTVLTAWREQRDQQTKQQSKQTKQQSKSVAKHR